MKKVMFVLMCVALAQATAFASVKEKVYVIPNATATIVNKAAEGTNENAAGLVGGVNRTLHDAARDLNEFGKSIYRGFFGGTIDEE